MYINGKWYDEPELQSYVNELKGKIEERDKFIHCVRSYYRETISWDELFEEEYKKLAADMNVPTTTAARHGKWISENDRPKSVMFVCSECGNIAHDRPLGSAKFYKIKKCNLEYCPHCGAKMDGGGSE